MAWNAIATILSIMVAVLLLLRVTATCHVLEIPQKIVAPEIDCQCTPKGHHIFMHPPQLRQAGYQLVGHMRVVFSKLIKHNNSFKC
jgi:hypothetical protein